ncbi:MAG: aminotransferase class I/II-fold pyridoxal phosphate-dependent enzyme, partial [Opitutales bacterium]
MVDHLGRQASFAWKEKLLERSSTPGCLADMSEDIPYSRQWIDEQDLEAVERILRSDYLTQGPAVEAFERALAERFSIKRAVVCSTGTAALHLAYAGLGVNEKSIGIVPSITFAATANTFLYLGSEVTFCDVDPATGLLSPESLEEILNERDTDSETTNLVVPVSFSGNLAPLRKTAEIAKKHGYSVVEDAAHSPGAWKVCASGENDKSGACVHTQAAILSFHPVKHICCGE